MNLLNVIQKLLLVVCYASRFLIWLEAQGWERESINDIRFLNLK